MNSSQSVATKTTRSVALAKHLVRLPGTDQWALWRWVGLRGAGFPARLVLRLATPECAFAADQLLAAEDEAECKWLEALSAVNTALDQLPRATDGADKERRNDLVKALQRLKQAKQPRIRTDVPIVRTALEAFQAARAGVDTAYRAFSQEFEIAQRRNSEELREIAGNARFREAITWQNRRVLHTGLDPLLQMAPGTSSSRHRKNEHIAASYLQRYCTKNDSIGFFGPIGWARVSDAARTFRVQPGPSLLASRQVYFEPWSIDAICQSLAQDAALREWLIPRRYPYVRQEGEWLHLPLQDAVRLNTAQGQVLAACDGERTARQIAHDLQHTAPDEWNSPTDVYQQLSALEQSQLIAWTLEAPHETGAEYRLRRRLEQIEDKAVRARSLSVLNQMEHWRELVADAAGDAERLDKAQKELEEGFERVTGVGATRAHGEIYAGRTLAYEDCRRDVQVEIGLEVLETIGPALGLILQSARWMTWEVQKAYREAFRQIYAELAQQRDESAVDVISFWRHAEPLLIGSENQLLDNLTTLFQRKWSEVLPLNTATRQVRYESSALRERVAATFAAPKAGWICARYQSPDLMIAAESVAAIQRGDYFCVLGELHLATNTLDNLCFVLQHPSPDDLYRSVDRDLPEPRVVPVIPKNVPGPRRTKPVLESKKDFYLDYGIGSPDLPRARTIPAASLVVEGIGPDLICRTRDRNLCFDVIEFFGSVLSGAILDRCKLFKPNEHLPRVTIDRLVVQRETWSLRAADADFAFLKDKSACFLDARRWARSHHLPRHVFVKVPVEVKPVYIDFTSPVYVQMLAKLVRRSMEESAEAKVQLTEMLPGFNQLWLPDADGERYTSELRLVALDLAGATEDKGESSATQCR